MKRLLTLLPLVLLLGCAASTPGPDRALDVRTRLLSGGCCFRARITADYGDMLYTFSMDCRADRSGGVDFTVTEPASISGISGSLDEAGGKLTFDETALDIALTADGQLAPVSAPWLLLHTLRGGCIVAGGEEDGLLHLIIDDTYEADAMTLDIWLDEAERPVRADVSWQGRRVLAMEIGDFQYE